MDNVEKKDSNDSLDTDSKESSTYSNSKHFFTHADFIWLNNKVNAQVGLNKTFKKQFNFINANSNKLSEIKVLQLTAIISTPKNKLGELRYDTANQSQGPRLVQGHRLTPHFGSLRVQFS